MSDPMTDVIGPVWRTLDPRFAPNAIAHVRAGGHAVLRGDPRWWLLLLPSDDDR